jgi:hypothetical protein
VGGLRDRGSQWRTDLGFGQLPVGVPLTKSFHVFNTGGLGGSGSVHIGEGGGGHLCLQIWGLGERTWGEGGGGATPVI